MNHESNQLNNKLSLLPDIKELTSARIAIGRSGGSLPTREILNFDQAHARARDAVWTSFEPELLVSNLQNRITCDLKPEIMILNSSAIDRATYLKRPDLGRRLDQSSVEKLSKISNRPELVVIISDGLSSQAASEQAPRLLSEFLAIIKNDLIKTGPIIVIPKARVGISDHVGQLTHAKGVVMLLGERPGLATPESLGVYYSYMPRSGTSDADRNCLSNIHSQGLSPENAASILRLIINHSFMYQSGGVELSQKMANKPLC